MYLALDLARVNAHLTEKEIQTGIYEIATDMNLDGSITALDLAQLFDIIVDGL